jgi:hypothetical protein
MAGTAVVLDMDDRHAFGAGAVQQVGNPAHNVLAAMQRRGQGEHALLDVDHHQCARHRDSYSIGTKIEWRILPEMALEKCPLPEVSSTSSTSPAPMMRVSPSLAWMLTPPSRLMMYCRRGAGCHS